MREELRIRTIWHNAELTLGKNQSSAGIDRSGRANRMIVHRRLVPAEQRGYFLKAVWRQSQQSYLVLVRPTLQHVLGSQIAIVTTQADQNAVYFTIATRQW